MKSLRGLALLALAVAAAALNAASPAFDQFVDRFTEEWTRADPIQATATQYFSGAEQDALDRQLNGQDFQYGTPLDAVARARRVQMAQDGMTQLGRFSAAELSPVQRISQATLAWGLNDAIQRDAVTDHRFVFEQFRGLQVGLVNFLSQTHPIRHGRDVENYLARLAQVAPVLDQGIGEAIVRAARGVIPPRFILQSTLDGIDRFLAPDPAQNVLVASLDDRAAKVETISAESRVASVAVAAKIVQHEVIPAFRRIRVLLAEQMTVATDDAGLWRLPRGAEAYASALATNTTTSLSPDEIHAIGLREVARIEAEMNVLFQQLGYAEGTTTARYEKLRDDSQPPAGSDPRPALLATFEQILREAERRSPSAFDLRPTASLVVQREPLFTEKSAAAHYYPPARDGSRPGIFWVPLPGPTYNVPGMRSLAYHEGVPGHHFQLSLQQESSEIPKFRQLHVMGVLSAFAEGWALYTEQLAVELGWYEGDVRGHLGQLNAELFRARRLVVDTGLHAKKWTRQQAIDYGLSAAEVERYVVMPGQACSYKIGMLKLLELRAKAQRELGAKFSLKEFHNVLLRTGSVPLDVLDRVIGAWISSGLAP